MKGFKKLLITILAISAISSAVLIGASAASAAQGAGTVSCAALNVRTEASTSGSIAATLHSGDTVVILDKTGSWYHISSGGTAGYVSSMYIKDVETTKDFTAAGKVDGSDIRMRSTPSTSGTVLGTYTAGTIMSVAGISDGWYKVSYNGQTGYVRSDYLTLTDASAVAVSVAAVSAGQQIADYARQFAGYRYVYGASSPKVGFDCSGLTYYVFNQFGYSISRTASQQYRNNGTSVSKADLQPGDLVFFSSNGGASVTHVGLYIGGGSFVNASTEKTGVIISSLSSAWYTKTWYGAKRIAG
ncbi:SH3 domain-containing protein [Sporobacter termitidis DSM 10068]|uniref:SH3 domain-containing protein n=1 Tax=Sporobacter termitidis DSM 10068 TaxID=1123282 RepID=A0A1M5YLI7_9FIRM|nr:C40 family peptidase [Sporobacter termitidis]SHI12872.1 SH3 domain-containing protein [Sporobacter termitidis DSM 10068]